MLSTVLFFFLLDIATSNIVFLTPSNGQEFATNQTIKVKWGKVDEVSNYKIKWSSGNGPIFQVYKIPAKCKPRIWIGPLPEGNWKVTVDALDQTNDPNDPIESGVVSFTVTNGVPCSNGIETEACPAGQVLRYYTAPGYKVQGTTACLTFLADDEQACVSNCTNNTRPDSSPAPCKSVNFNNQSNECKIYPTETFPQGSANMEKDNTTNHYEKLCINATLGDRCQGPYFVEPNMSMTKGFEWQYSSIVNGTNACLEQCIDSQALFGFVCRSAFFRTEDYAYNCAFSNSSRLTDPDGYGVAPDDNNIEHGCAP